MKIDNIINTYDYECNVSNLFAFAHEHSSIISHTIRTKGQLLMQRFFYIVGGYIEFVTNDKKVISAKQGDIVYLPKDVTYNAQWKSTDDSSAISIQFDLKHRDADIILSDEMMIIAHDKYQIFLKQFNYLVNTYNDGHLGYKIKCQSIFFDILYLIIPELIKKPIKKNNSLIYKGILYIENNYMDAIDPDKLAALCSMCPSAFRKKFKEITGMSPIKYKNYLLMKKAAEFLKQGELTAAEVARKLKMNDIYYFNKLFKNFYGIPPKMFSNQFITKSSF